MRPPCELVVIRDYLPLLRKKLIHLLVNEGFNQHEIASKLGISQPRVSQYLSKNEETSSAEEYQETYFQNIEKIATEIFYKIKANRSNAEILSIICQNCKSMRHSGPFCRLHFKHDDNFAQYFSFTPKNCNVCHTTQEIALELTKKEKLLNQFQALLQNLKFSTTLINFIPEIGSQIVIMRFQDKLQRENIAGIPGRIRKIKHSLQIEVKPEFGASNLLAQILIEIRSMVNYEYTISLAIKTSKNLEKFLQAKRSQLIHTKEFDLNHTELIKNIKNIDQNFPLSIIDSGGIGLEAITYVFYRNIADFSDFWEINTVIL